MQGIVLVAFGEDYARLAIENMKYSKQFHNLPYCVLTNVKGVPDSIYFNLAQKENRYIKTCMDEFTPFDVTYYMDVDAVIQNPLPDLSFETDLLLNQLLYWKENDKVLRIYKRTMDTFNVGLPLTVFNGGFIGFKKNERTRRFFKTWNTYWKRMGKGREMPSLACSIKNEGISVTTLKKDIFEPERKNINAVIQHDYGTGFWKYFNFTKPKTFKPFDTDPKDWIWV